MRSKVLTLTAMVLCTPFVLGKGCRDTPDSGTDSDSDATDDDDTTSGDDDDDTTGSTGVQECNGDGTVCVHHDPADMDHQHTVGVSACPDPMGSITISVGGAAAAAASYTLTGPNLGGLPGILFPVGAGHEPQVQGEVAVGATEEIHAFFSCYTQDSFTDFVTVAVDDGSTVLEVQVPVSVDVTQ